MERCYFRKEAIMFDWLLVPAGMFVLGAAANAVAKSVLPKWWRGISIKLRKDIKEKAKIYLKDPEWRAIVSQIVLKVQKEMGSQPNVDKLNKAVDMLCKFSPIPDNLERPIYEAMVEIVIEEAKKPIDLG